MAALLPNSVFLHNRKTGGMWVREVLGQLEGSRILGRPQAEDLRDAPARVIHMTFDEAKVALRGKQRFYFTFVRNPYSWLESFYGQRRRLRRTIRRPASRSASGSSGSG